MQTIPEECRQYIEVIVSVAKQFLSKGESLQAIAFLGKFGCQLMPVPMDMAHKDQSLLFISEICKHTEPDYVIMLSEAWALSEKASSEELRFLCCPAWLMSNLQSYFFK